MKRSRRKLGFTLVELLVTIILLGVVGAIVIYNMTSVTSTSKEAEYERFISAVKSAASVYADEYPEVFKTLYEDKAFIYFEVGDLITRGLLDENLKNPYKEEKIGKNEQIKANLDSTTGYLNFEYPVENNDEESFLVAISDYVVWGEPYDCMEGAGSYKLSLSDEKGNLIMLDDKETIKKYNFSCSLPSDFADYYKVVDGVTTKEVIGKYTKNAGSYEITYKWVTESGTSKSATRILKVLPKVTPTFKTNYEYDFSASDWFIPSYDKSTKTWKYLTYTPYIEGADMDSTVFRIYKKGNNPVSGAVEVTDGWSTEYKERPVDDGDKTYMIETIVSGHHYKDYKYVAEGSEVIKSELVIPADFITGGNTTWAADKTFSISDVYSPVGVKEYEYAVATSVKDMSKDLAIENTHVFERTKGITTKNVDILDNSCLNQLYEYPYVYFRAINEDGYAGAWSASTTANLTNHLAKLINTDSTGCTSCNSCCLPTSNGSCYYCNKQKFVSYGGKKFILLDKDKKGNIIAAYNGISGNKVTPTSYRSSTWSIVTCDGTFSKNYRYSSPVLKNITDEANRFLDALPEDYDQYLNYKAWSKSYSAYVGTVNRTMFNKYGKALHDSHAYWTTDTYSSGFTIYVDTPYAHGNSTTKYNTYFYAIADGKISTAYAGTSAYVKPLVEFNDSIYVCGGNGSSDRPYIVATNS